MEKKYENIVELLKDTGLVVKDVQGDNIHELLANLINLLCKKIQEMDSVISDMQAELYKYDTKIGNFNRLDDMEYRIRQLED